MPVTPTVSLERRSNDTYPDHCAALRESALGTALTLRRSLANGSYYRKKRTLATVAGPLARLPLWGLSRWRAILEYAAPPL